MKEKTTVTEKALLTLFVASGSCVCVLLLLILFTMGAYMTGFFEIRIESVELIIGVGMIVIGFTLLTGFSIGIYVEFIKGRLTNAEEKE